MSDAEPTAEAQAPAEEAPVTNPYAGMTDPVYPSNDPLNPESENPMTYDQETGTWSEGAPAAEEEAADDEG
jgi:hypothetical protein